MSSQSTLGDIPDWKRLGGRGAAYRQTARDTTASSPDPDTECQGCQGHVSRRFVRVFGVDGQVWDCPQCASARDIMGGPFADSGPGGQG